MSERYRIVRAASRSRRFLRRVGIICVGALLSSFPVAANDDPLREIVQRAAETGAVDWNLRVDCVGKEHIRGMNLVAGSVGVWDLWTQVTLSTDTRRALAVMLLEGDFFGLQAEYGGKTNPDASADEEKPPARAQRVICRVEVESVLHGERVRRSSIQFADGEQSPELKRLANALLDLVAPLASSGVQPEDFADALRLLKQGKIDPRLLAVRMVEIPRRGSDVSGTIFRIEEGWASAQPYVPGRLVGEISRGAMEIATLKEVVAAFSGAGFDSLPINLWGENQLEVHAEVLGHRRTVYARPFARLDSEQGEPSQRAFSELTMNLRRLAEAVQ